MTWRERALVVLTAVLGVAARAALQPLLGDQLPFLIAYPAIAFAASQWGSGSGAFVALGCGVAAAVPGVPPTIPVADQPFQIGSYAAAAVFISLVCGARARDRADPVLVRGDATFDTPITAWLRAVLWGSVLLPVTAFVGAAWWGYENAYSEAEAAAARAAVLVHGQAERTFGIAENIAHLADQVAAGSDDDVHRREALAHQRLSDMVAGLPSVVNLNVWDVNGMPLVRSDRFPAGSAASVADRSYFLEQKAAATHGALAVSEVLRGRQTGIELMNATIRRSAPGDAFNGVVTVSLAPRSSATTSARWRSTTRRWRRSRSCAPTARFWRRGRRCRTAVPRWCPATRSSRASRPARRPAIWSCRRTVTDECVSQASSA